MKVQTHSEHTPSLRPRVWLRPMPGYAIVHGHHPSRIRIVHPSDAFFLSLCNGELSTDQIAFLFAQTYGLSDSEARQRVGHMMQTFQIFLDLENVMATGERPPYGPRTFLYAADDEVLAEADHGRWPVPAGINLTLTFKCNFNCSYCYQDLTQSSHSQWNVGKCIDVVEEAADWGVIFFGLTGGEPTIFKGWMDVLERGLDRGMIPTLTSNGSVVGGNPEIPRRLADIGLREMTISLDASTPRLHDRLTVSTGHFERVTQAIHGLAEAGIRVTVKSVLTPETASDVEDLIDLVAGLGASEIGITYMETGAAGSSANSKHNVAGEELERVRLVARDKAREHAGECLVHAPRDPSLRWNEDEWYPCGGINMGMSIFPSGDVTVCDKLHGVEEFTYGNVFDHGLRAIWESETFRRLRERSASPELVDPDCLRCSKLRHCRTSCFIESFNATGSYYAKDPRCGGPFQASRP